ncbi:MAG TPA: DUF2723 domain-containing protein [Phycisphaerae bacterium]|nr:DUF2723 domain-containing protein [Phycisphaerae bacterium]
MTAASGTQPFSPDKRGSVRGKPPMELAARRASPSGREYLVALLAALVFYLVSMAPGPLWQDSGLAQVRVLQGDLHGNFGLALSHPLYYVLAIGFQYLPLGESAFKTNLVSAVFGALTVANAFLLLRVVTRRRTPAVVGALSLAVAHTFWQHCALAEVYTVSTALLVTELLCLRQYARHGNSRWLVLLFLTNGVGVSNHVLAVLSLACYGIMLLWLLLRRKVAVNTVILSGLAWLLGAGLYLGMILGEIMSGAGVGETARSALFGSHYERYVLNLVPGGRLLVNSLQYLALNFPTPVALLALTGLLALPTMRPRLFARVLGGLLVVHLLWAVRYDVVDQYTFFIPSVVLIALLIGVGAERFLQRRRARWRGVLIVGALLPAIVYIPLPQIARAAGLKTGVSRKVPYRNEYKYFLHPWKTGYRGAEQFADELCEALPPGAVLVADGTTVRPIHYLQLTHRWREDIRVWPSLDPAQPSWPATEEELRPQLDAGLVYVVAPQKRYCPQWLLDGYDFTTGGIVHRVRPRGDAASRPAAP